MTQIIERDRYIEWLDLKPPERAREVLNGWEFVGLYERGELAGIAMLSGTEIHFVVAPEWRGKLITRRRTRAFLKPLMARYGFLTTRSFVGDLDSFAFLNRLGFIRTWTFGDLNHWMLTELPFSRET